MSISTTVKAIQDIMRIDEGVDGDAQRISQLTWMLFLNIFDDREMEAELFEDDYISAMPEGLRWRDWAANDEGMTGETLLDFVSSKLFKSLKNLDLSTSNNPKSRILKEAFEDGFNFTKNGTLIRQVINKINEIDFNNSQDKHLFGEIYEKILKDLQNAGNAGEYYTPRAVTQFMVNMIKPQLGERILDAACGTGGFLTCALNHLRKQVKTVEEREKLSHLIMGVEKKHLPHLLCITNLLLHEIDAPKVRRDNTLANPLRNYQPSDKVEVILTNPPFGGKEEDGIEGGVPKAYQTKETADLFLVLIIHLLEVGGRGSIVLPDGNIIWGRSKDKN